MPGERNDRDRGASGVGEALEHYDRQAGAGEVLLSMKTRERIARAGVRTDDRGARSFKNVTAPLAVFAEFVPVGGAPRPGAPERTVGA